MRAQPISLCSALLVVWLFHHAAGFAGGQARSVRQDSGADVCRLVTLADEAPGDEGEDAGEEEGIRDKSFLVEEAYNQEAGVVQHIVNFVPAWDSNRGLRARTLDFVFTQERPIFSQRHQMTRSDPKASKSGGVG